MYNTHILFIYLNSSKCLFSTNFKIEMEKKTLKCTQRLKMLTEETSYTTINFVKYILLIYYIYIYHALEQRNYF